MQAASSLPIAGATNDSVSVPAVVRQLRVNVLVVATLLLLYLAMEFQAHPGLALRLIEPGTICLGLVAIAFPLTFSELFARHWRGVTLIFCSLLLSTGTALSLILRMPNAYLAGLVLFSMGCAVFVPWEAKWQAAFNLICVCAFAIEETIVFPAEQYKIERLFAVALLMLAQLAARFVGGYRENLYSQIESVKKAEARLRAVLNSAPDAMIVVDKDGAITMANPQTQKLFGYGAAELLGRSVDILIPKRFSSDHPLYRADYLANPHHMRRMAGAVELHALRRDGGEFPVEINLSPVEGDAEGAVMCAIRDITARKRAERELLESEEKFKRIFEASLDAIAINSLADAKYLDFNEGYLKLTGYTRKEVLGRTPDELKIWANHAERAQASKELRTKGFIHNFEGEFLTKDGTRRSGLFSGVVVDLPEQPCVISFVRDITELMRAEKAIQRLAAIVEASEDAIASSTLDGTITSWNRGAERLFGYSAAEIIGQPTGSFVGPDAWPEFRQMLERIGQQGGVHRYDARRLKKDGTPVDISVTVSPIYDAAGAVVGASAIAKDITERKQAEQMRALLASVVDFADEAIYSTNLEREVTSWNPGAEKLYGYSGAEVIGRKLDVLVPADRLDEITQITFRLAAGQGVQHYETKRLRKDGTLVDVAITVSSILDASARFVGASVIARDITENKRAERKLRQSEEKFRKIFDASTEAISINSLADGRYIDVNGEFQKLTGYTREEVIGRTPRELKIWAEDDDLARAMRELRTRGFVRDFEADLPAKGGTRRSGLFSAVLIDVAEQRCILSFARDITERKQAEQTRSLLASIVQSADEAIYSANLDWKITSWNPGAEKLYGYFAAEVIGQTLDILFTPDRLDETRQLRARLMRGEGVQQFETRRAKKDGTLFDVSITASPIYDAAGAVVGVSAITKDVTERKLAERARELARSNAELEEFAHVVSHDLREPLHNVSSYVKLLANDYQGKLGADADEYIRYALDGAAWMQTLIEDLRTYARVTAQPKAIEPVDFGSVVGQAITNLSTAIDEHRATVTYEPMPTVAADGSAMTRVFQNLIENALKFRGEEPPRVHVAVERRMGDWVFSVRDNGIGIDPEHSHKIFMIFHRLHSRREYPGSGIGLAVCKKIVERHGGRIWVESEPGHGATFYFTIPA